MMGECSGAAEPAVLPGRFEYSEWRPTCERAPRPTAGSPSTGLVYDVRGSQAVAMWPYDLAMQMAVTHNRIDELGKGAEKGPSCSPSGHCTSSQLRGIGRGRSLGRARQTVAAAVPEGKGNPESTLGERRPYWHWSNFERPVHRCRGGVALADEAEFEAQAVRPRREDAHVVRSLRGHSQATLIRGGAEGATPL